MTVGVRPSDTAVTSRLEHLDGQRCARLRRTGAQAQRPDEATAVEVGGDVGDPERLLLLDPTGQTLLDLVLQRQRLLVTGDAVGGDDHRAQVTQVELVEIGERGIGAVTPLGGAQPGKELLGERDQLIGRDLGTVLGLGLLVLLGDGLAHGGHAATQDLLGDGTVLHGQGVQHGGAVHTTRAQTLRLRALGHRVGTRSTGTVAAGTITAGTVTTGAIATGASTATAGTADHRDGRRGRHAGHDGHRHGRGSGPSSRPACVVTSGSS